ncbi:MAG: hypothetical protein R6X35_06240 [Candidatus Krumholzibacteriia bacterium]
MNRCLVLVLVLLATNSFAQYPEDCRNGIGIFTLSSVPIDGMNLNSYSTYQGAPGLFTVYAILFRPHDDAGGQDLDRIGGFELRVVLPAGVFLLGTTLPAGATNATATPDFLVTMDSPVVGDQCVLVDLQLGEFTGATSLLYLAPPSTGGTLPGHMAIRGVGPTSGTTAAYPVSGDYDYPVFALWPWTDLKSSWTLGCGAEVPTRESSFGTLKSLYR